MNEIIELNILFEKFKSTLKHKDLNKITNYKNLTAQNIITEFDDIKSNDLNLLYCKKWLLQQHLRYALNNNELIDNCFSNFIEKITSIIIKKYDSFTELKENYLEINIVSKTTFTLKIGKARNKANNTHNIYIDYQILWLLLSHSIFLEEAIMYIQIFGNKELFTPILNLRII